MYLSNNKTTESNSTDEKTEKWKRGKKERKKLPKC